MKSIRGLILAMLGLLSFGALAQSTDMQDLTRDAVRANKKLIVAQNVPLTKEQVLEKMRTWPPVTTCSALPETLAVLPLMVQ